MKPVSIAKCEHFVAHLTIFFFLFRHYKIVTKLYGIEDLFSAHINIHKYSSSEWLSEQTNVILSL